MLWFAPVALAGMPQPGQAESPVASSGPRLPARATERVSWRSVSGLGSSFAPSGVASVDGISVPGGMRYPGAWPGADLEYRWVDGGIEDRVAFSARPEREELAYDLDVSDVAGLRLVENVLELVDAGGAPRLRVRAPTVEDRTGVHPARLDVSGCRVDRSAVAPWGRPVVAPGADHCSVVVRWSDVAYPATVDPAWVDGAAMSTTRDYHAAIEMDDGRVLVNGGYSSYFSSTYTPTAEIYDPVTGTWAVTTSMNHGRGHHGGRLLADGTILVAPGDDLQVASAEIYDPVAATWTDTAPMQVFRDMAGQVALDDGRFLVAGGCTAYNTYNCTSMAASAEIYDPATDTWSRTTNSMATSRVFFGMVALADGRALAPGGCTVFGYNWSCASGTNSADVFDPATDTWSATGAMVTEQRAYGLVRLGDDSILVAGGWGPFGTLRSSQTFDAATDTWTAAGNLVADHIVPGAALLPSGGAVIAGSWGTAYDWSAIAGDTETFDPLTRAWTMRGDLIQARAACTATPLDDGQVLVAGGVAGHPYFDSILATVERFDELCDDVDLDGFCDDFDACLLGDDRLESDGDGVPDACDTCPDTFDPLQVDSDLDGLGDECDACPTPADPLDTDGDQVCDSLDRCPYGDDLLDPDFDLLPSACDDCPRTANADQVDSDGDGQGDACDACPDPSDPLDSDQDDVCDSVDVCDGGDDTVDSDLDGVPDDCDPCPLDATDDSDGDGACDSMDRCPGVDDFGPDADADHFPDACDNCLTTPNDQANADGDASGDRCDCAATDPTINRAAEEVCDGVDQDCDGDVDEDAVDAQTWYPDADGDGQGNADYPTRACEAPAATVSDDRDCDDGDAAVRVGGTEVCNGIDDDCDGVVDPDPVCAAPSKEDPAGCGCATGGSSGNAVLLLVAAGVLRQRRLGGSRQSGRAGSAERPSTSQPRA